MTVRKIEKEEMSQLNRLQNVEEIPYPAAPWNVKGQFWMGLFKTDTPIQLPAGLKYLLDPHFMLVALARYLEGTLCYDELAFSVLARRGPRIGIYTDYIWVTDLASLWGGRRIWGVPKNLAEFAWKDSTVRVTDGQGLIAAIKVDMSPAKSPWMWMPTPTIGQLENGDWVYAVSSLWARFSRADMQIEEWSVRFGYHLDSKPALNFGAKPFRLRLPAAKVISHY